jgi:hypothetical protein
VVVTASSDSAKTTWLRRTTRWLSSSTSARRPMFTRAGPISWRPASALPPSTTSLGGGAVTAAAGAGAAGFSW